jgi:hypothetical protein
VDRERCEETFEDPDTGLPFVGPRPSPQLGTRQREPIIGSTSEGFYDDRLAERWDGGEPMRPDRTVSATISRFTPQKVSDEVWRRIEGFVRTAVTMAAPGTPFIADHEMTVVAQLVVWADRVGIPLDPALVLNPETVDRFLVDGCEHLTDGSRLNYRTHLWRIGAAVLGRELFPAKPLPLKRSAVLAPYTNDDITELTSWARGLSTSHMRRNTRALLAIGLGAGLTSEEIQRLVGTDVCQVGGQVLVEVIGKAPRTVAVTEDWADDVLALARESVDGPYFCPERSRITRRDVIGFIEKCSADSTAQFNVQRLRVTWIVHHLSAGTHLVEFQKMAGVSAGQLVKYLKFAAPLGATFAPGEEIRQPGFAGRQLHTN